MHRFVRPSVRKAFAAFPLVVLAAAATPAGAWGQIIHAPLYTFNGDSTLPTI